jgi:hypothetical protein
LFGQDLFKSAPVFAPTLDDLFHHSLRAFGLARADCVAHIYDHIVVFDHADPIIVES